MEMGLVAMVALLVVGPQKLPGMLRTLGEWMGRARRLMTEMRAQTGIDDILREEGIDGVAELRSLLRGEIAAARSRAVQDPAADAAPPDPNQEYPSEGADARGALPDDLIAASGAPAPSLELPPQAPSDPRSPDLSVRLP